jgi:hypothetical protein
MLEYTSGKIGKARNQGVIHGRTAFVKQLRYLQERYECYPSIFHIHIVIATVPGALITSPSFLIIYPNTVVLNTDSKTSMQKECSILIGSHPQDFSLRLI